MKKILFLFAAFLLTFSLAACGGEELAELPEEVTMENLDEYLDRPDVQYVDVRNFDDKLNSGYIEGFEMIPFFDYLEYEGILVRTDGWNFEAASLQNESALKALFNEDKAIFIMCGSGTRAAFVKSALEAAGYENVYNVGGIADYSGDYKVLGDGSYTIDMPVKGDYTPGIYYGMSESNGYMATVIINEAGGIEEVILNALNEMDPDGVKNSGDEYVTTKQALQGDYGMLGITGKGWFEHANELAAALVANQGWNPDWEIVAGDRHDKFNPEDEEVIMDGIAGVTIGIEGFKVAFEEAIGQAE